MNRIQTGIAGLDDILGGGLPPRRLYLIQGDPGAGKTTLALRFLLEGVKRGERVLYVTLSETLEELGDIARSHGWSLEGLSITEISSNPTAQEAETTLYHPSELELGDRVQSLLDRVDKLKPTRIVLDSCSELRLLAQSGLRYRRQIMALKQRLADLGSTILLLDNPQPGSPDMLLQSVVHGVISMEQLAPLFGAERRRLRICKLRGVKYRGGYHDCIIQTGGLVVFPRLVAAEHHGEFARKPVSSGLNELDAMLGGGPDRGSSLLLIGSSGCGKSALASQFALAAAERGERSAVFSFDESRSMYLARASSLGVKLHSHVESGRILIQQVDPAELSPGEFTHTVRRSVEAGEARLVFIDSLNGYLNAMPEERYLVLQLHELFAYLSQHGVLTVTTVAQQGILSQAGEAPVELSYLADTVLLLRYVEIDGELKKVITAVKKRSGWHERTIRELSLTESGIRVGPVLRQFQGVLRGVPTHWGNGERRPSGFEDRGE